jgi:hypothetical protein
MAVHDTTLAQLRAVKPTTNVAFGGTAGTSGRGNRSTAQDLPSQWATKP